MAFDGTRALICHRPGNYLGIGLAGADGEAEDLAQGDAMIRVLRMQADDERVFLRGIEAARNVEGVRLFGVIDGRDEG